MQPNVERLASGFRFAEGPVWHGPRDVTFVDLAGQLRLPLAQWRRGRSSQPQAEPERLHDRRRRRPLRGQQRRHLPACRWKSCCGPRMTASLDASSESRSTAWSRHVADGAAGPDAMAPRRSHAGARTGSLYFTDPHNWEELWGVPPNADAYGVGSLCRVRRLRHRRAAWSASATSPTAWPWTRSWSVPVSWRRRTTVSIQVDGASSMVGCASRASFCRMRPRAVRTGSPSMPPGVSTSVAASTTMVATRSSSTTADGHLELTYDLPAGFRPDEHCLGGRRYLPHARAARRS